MEKHLKDELVPPDHVNPKLSAGISEVIEMMMAKSRRERYKTAKDVLVDLRAAKKGEHPPIAHKEATAEVLMEFAEMQAKSPAGEIPQDRSRERSVWSEPSVRLVVAGLVIAVIYGIVMTVVLAMTIAG
jgi:serine/threonine-protein kinase